VSAPIHGRRVIPAKTAAFPDSNGVVGLFALQNAGPHETGLI
jgi:hypothetical protein